MMCFPGEEKLLQIPRWASWHKKKERKISFTARCSASEPSVIAKPPTARRLPARLPLAVVWTTLAVTTRPSNDALTTHQPISGLQWVLLVDSNTTRQCYRSWLATHRISVVFLAYDTPHQCCLRQHTTPVLPAYNTPVFLTRNTHKARLNCLIQHFKKINTLSQKVYSGGVVSCLSS